MDGKGPEEEAGEADAAEKAVVHRVSAPGPRSGKLATGQASLTWPGCLPALTLSCTDARHLES